MGRYIKPKIAAWFESLRGSEYLRDVTREVQTELQAEAGNYVSIVEEIEGHVDGRKHASAVQEQLKEWLQGPAVLSGTMNDLGFDLGATGRHPAHRRRLAHDAQLPARSRNPDQWRADPHPPRPHGAEAPGTTPPGITDKMPEFRSNQHEAIREALSSGFGKINDSIKEKITVDVLLISTSMEA